MDTHKSTVDFRMISYPRREAQMAWENLNVLVEKVALLEDENYHLKLTRDNGIDDIRRSEAGLTDSEAVQKLTNDLNNARQREKDLSDQLLSTKEEVRRLRTDFETLQLRSSTNEQLLKGKDELLSALREQHRNDMEKQKQNINDQHQIQVTQLQENLSASKSELDKARSELKELKMAHQRCEAYRAEVSAREQERENTDQLRYVVQNIESQLNTLKEDISLSFNQLSPRSEQLKKEETDKHILTLSAEFERMKVELEKMINEYDTHRQVTVQQRLRAKEKYYELKRTNKNEQEKLGDRIRKLESTLYLTEQELKKEQEFRERATRRDHELHEANRNLLNKCVENEENIRELQHELSLMKSKLKRLKSDNTSLTDRNEILLKKVHDLNLSAMRAGINKGNRNSSTELYKILSSIGNVREPNSLPSIIVTASN